MYDMVFPDNRFVLDTRGSLVTVRLGFIVLGRFHTYTQAEKYVDGLLDKVADFINHPY